MARKLRSRTESAKPDRPIGHLKHLVCFSDLHAGSDFAVAPPRVRLDRGGIYEASEDQLQLWKYWCEFWEEWVPRATNGEPYAVVALGDLIEGRHHGSLDNFTAKLSDQERVALAMLLPVREKANRFFMIRGTEAHAGASGETEESLASKLGAEVEDDEFSTHSRWGFRAVLDGRYRLSMSHHISTTASNAYEASALCRELVAMFTEAGQWESMAYDVVVRAHRHRYVQLKLPSKRGVTRILVTPGWQLRTPFAMRSHAMRTPQIGGICISSEPWGLAAKEWIRPFIEPEPTALTVDLAKAPSISSDG